MSDDALRNLLSRGVSEEELARALLDLTLQAAPPEVADAVRVCALPAWFNANLLAFLVATPSPPQRFLARIRRAFKAKMARRKAAALLERVAAFSFVMSRERGGYVYHEATRERLLDWWGKPENRPRFAVLVDRLARLYLALAEEQDPRLSGPAYLEALAALDAAYPNVRAAWQEVLESENWELIRSFAYALAEYQNRRGLWAEKITWAQKGLAACQHLGDEAGAAAMQNGLGNAYVALPTGERAANLRQAIECYQEALRFYTPEAAPPNYAATQNNLGTAYSDLPTGERAANLARAIECYQEALRFRTPEAAPLDYAMTQNNLGTAYHNLPTGDRGANLGRAIACYQEALKVYTPEAAPLQYAMTQNNLGAAYADLPTGDRGANLGRAIACYEQALTVYTAEEDPFHYAGTQNNLGLAYVHLPTGDRTANLDKALECAEVALQAEGLAPWEQAEYLFTRGLIRLALGHLDQALADCQAAMPLATAITMAEALKELDQFAAGHPDTPGLDTVRALLSK